LQNLTTELKSEQKLPVKSSLVTVIEIGTETAVFSQYGMEAKPRFYASLLTVLETEQL